MESKQDHKRSQPAGLEPHATEVQLNPELFSFVVDVGPTAIQSEKCGDCETTQPTPIKQSEGSWLVELSDGERLDGSSGQAVRVPTKDSVMEIGEIYADRRDQESVPFLPDSVDLVDVNSAPPGSPFGDSRLVLFTGSAGEFLRGQILNRNGFKADRHGDDSKAVDLSLRCRAPSPTDGRCESASCRTSCHSWKQITRPLGRTFPSI